MSRDKQIEEIKSLNLLLEDITVDKVLYTSDGEVVDAFKVPAVALDVTNQLANILYNAGYRKASNLAEEIFAEIKSIMADFPIYGHTNTLIVNGNDFAELKKKYIGKDTNVTTNTEEGK